jgi:hypothetical protein
MPGRQRLQGRGYCADASSRSPDGARVVKFLRPLREISTAGLSMRSPLRFRFLIGANMIDALRFAAFVARFAEHHSAEGTAPRSPSRRDEAVAPRGRLVPDKRRLLLLARQRDLRPRAGHEKVFAPFGIAGVMLLTDASDLEGETL